ncbi:ABC transporter substrate-binding protein [Streptomyces mashuensis]|uniref:ABC transporter substrate-binding protein n=1 Tax=Streptomyces mashuensis TaxID=33904 RepID=A0A919AV47_9ACTN|nr:ABC transporter permease [Streptomyces mashuensis]GHF25353.1 ABC transporter substrate-binding protein [Streptomyces mashuensis]
MFVALRDIRFARGRFALMGTVVVLITMLVVFLNGLTGGLAREATSAVAGLPAGRVVFGAPAWAAAEVSFGNSTVDERQLAAWRAAPGVTSAEPLGVAMTRLTAGGTASSVSVFGSTERLRPELLRGTAPRDGQVAVGERVAREHGLRVGGTVTLGSRELVVAGITPDRSHGHAPTVWATLGTWSLVGHQPQPTVLAVTGDGGPSGAVAASTRAVELDDALPGIPGYAAEQGTLRLVEGFLLVVSALVVGAFFTVWTVQRRPEVAVLKAVGASGGYLVRDALAQALAVLGAGALLGGALGALGGWPASAAVPFELSTATVAVPVAAMVLLGLAGAALAVRRITSVDPLTALGAHR